MALLVGLGGGLGVLKASDAETQWEPGLAAALAALAVIPFTKEIIVEWTRAAPPHEFFDRITLVSDEIMIACIADDIALEWDAQGRALDWPQDLTWEEAVFRECYPLDLWHAATEEWNTMPQNVRERLMQEHEAQARQILEDHRRATLRDTDPQHDTGGAELMWIVLAVLLAVGAGMWRPE